MGIAVLGPLTIDGVGGLLRHHDRVVLTVLAVRPGEPVSADRLADALWGDSPPASWSKVVQGCVVRLRKVLGAESIETTPQGYRLAVPRRRGRRPALRAAPGTRPRAARRWASRSGPRTCSRRRLALWRGRRAHRARRLGPGGGSRRRGSTSCASTPRSCGSTRRCGRASTARCSARRRRWWRGAAAGAAVGAAGPGAVPGRPAGARRCARCARHARCWRRELGLDPGPELVALEQAILRQDPALVVERGACPSPSAVCPYRGLVPYDVADADAFFGRDADVAAVPAPAGARRRAGGRRARPASGKSSLVRAGVAAALRARREPGASWSPPASPARRPRTVPARAGRRCSWSTSARRPSPCASDPTSGRGSSPRWPTHAERAPLVRRPARRPPGRPRRPPGVRPAASSAACTCSAPMDETGPAGRDRGTGPAGGAAARAGPGRPAACARSRAKPGALPLLSHALRQTWERREGRTLTVAGYRATRRHPRRRRPVGRGGLRHRSPAEQRPMLRDLLLRLVTPRPDGGAGAQPGAAPPLVTDDRSTSSSSSSSSRSAGDQRRRRASSSPTRPSPGPGHGCAAGSTTTSRASGSCATSPSPPTLGQPWAAPTASSTAASGWPRRSTGGSRAPRT